MANTASEMVRSRPITADEFHRMGEIGILGPDERVELLNGRIVEMPPIGHRHSYVVVRLDALLQRALGDRAVIVVQGPIRLDRLSEPQPDLLILRVPVERYATRHATADDTLLVIEVAESTLRYDRGEKLRAYARMGITEYWIVDVVHERIYAFTEPEGERYLTGTLVERGGRLAPRAFPDDHIAINDILVPPT